MKRFFKTLWFKILAAILAVLILFTIIAGVSARRGSPLSSTIGIVAEPFEIVASGVSRGAGYIKHLFTRSTTYEKRIEELENQVTEYQKDLADYESAKQKLEQYEAFLGIQEDHTDYEVLSASVIGKDSANNYTTFVLNKGTASGVKVNDPVIYGAGQLVGVVTKVAPTYCVISTILDPNISISVYDIRTRESGYITNTTELAAQGLCKLSGLNRDTAVTKGAIINTAGSGGIYPRDLVIGTVTNVQNDDYNLSAFATVKPNITIADVQEVLILTAFDGQGISVATDSGASSSDATSPEIESSPSTTTSSSTTSRRRRSSTTSSSSSASATESNTASAETVPEQ